MRTHIAIAVIIIFSMLVLPVFAVFGEKNEHETTNEELVSVSQDETKNAFDEEYISVLSSATGNVDKMTVREYVIGSVAAEMPAVYHTQALKAQAVASYTYAKRIGEQNEKYKDPSLGDADISDNTKSHQGYLNKKDRREKWGDNFDEYEKKIETAVDEVLGYYIEYNGETALAVYHSISAGRTQSAESVWGTDIPYLISVESPGDRLSPDYISEKSFDEDEFEKYAEECGVKIKGKTGEWLGESTVNEAGYVTSVCICSKEISASKFREVFGIKGMSFDIEYVSGAFTVTSRGYGHGVGMSQYGADYMARQGSTWREILSHYYPGTTIAVQTAQL